MCIRDRPLASYGFGEASTFASRSGVSPLGSNLFLDSLVTGDLYFYSINNTDPLNPQLIKNFVVLEVATNNDKCLQDFLNTDQFLNAGLAVPVDGAGVIGQPGVVEGTPTAVFNDNQIDQLVNGASIQFNWSFEEHKFMAVSYTHLNSIHLHKEPHAYIRTIANNLIVNEFHAGKRFVSLDADVGLNREWLDTPILSTENLVDIKQRLEYIQQILDKLPPRCRQVFWLYRVEGYTHSQIAEKLEISKNMVERHAMRALLDLSNARELIGLD